jgi:hypothetical protein
VNCLVGMKPIHQFVRQKIDLAGHVRVVGHFAIAPDNGTDGSALRYKSGRSSSRDMPVIRSTSMTRSAGTRRHFVTAGDVIFKSTAMRAICPRFDLIFAMTSSMDV